MLRLLGAYYIYKKSGEAIAIGFQGLMIFSYVMLAILFGIPLLPMIPFFAYSKCERESFNCNKRTN